MASTLILRWLDARLAEWLAEGIITEAQARAMRERAGRGRPGDGRSPFVVLAALGGICVALGMVLLVAWNWESIHRGWKLAGLAALLASTGEWMRRLPRERWIGRAAGSLVWMLLPLAGIGLIGQIYQLSGATFSALLLWLALSAPVAWLATEGPGGLLHAAGIVVAIWVGAFEASSWVSLHTTGATMTRAGLASYAPALAGIALLWGAAVVEARRFAGPGSRAALLVALLSFVGALRVFETPLHADDMAGNLLLAGALAALFWGAAPAFDLDPDGVAGDAGHAVCAVLLYGLTFLWHGHGLYDHPAGLAGPAGFLPVGAVAVAIGLLILLPWRRLAASNASGAVLKALALWPAWLGVFLLARAPYKLIAVLANAGLAALGLWLMADGVARRRPGRVTVGTLLFGVLILTRFLDYFGTMLQSGVGFIVTGLVFIGIAWGMHRARQRLLGLGRGARP